MLVTMLRIAHMFDLRGDKIEPINNFSQHANAKIWLTHHSHIIVTKAKIRKEELVVKDGETATS